MNAPKISVLMPVFNGEAYLSAAVESILRQSFADFEFIIIDDGSTDGSRRILDDYASADPRVRLLSRDACMGIPSALNLAIKSARAPIFARFDCDDVAMPHRLKTQLDWLERDPGLSAVGSWAWLIDAAGKRNGRIKKQPVGKERVRSLLPLRNCLLHPATMFHRAAAEKAGNYDERFRWAQDYDLWLRILPHGALDNIPEPLFELRRHPEQVSGSAKRRGSTICSVAAAMNFQCRKYGVAELTELSTEAGHAFVGTAEALFRQPLARIDKVHLVRHLIRLRRYSFHDGTVAEALKSVVSRNVGTFWRGKMDLYDLLKRLS